MNMKVPSMLWVTILLVLPPMLIPWIEQFFPTETYWWSALIVVLLNAVVLVVKATWGNSAQVKTPSNVQSDMMPNQKPQSLAGKLLIWGA